MAFHQMYTLGDILDFPLANLKNRKQFCLGETKASKECRRMIRLEVQIEALSILQQCVYSFDQDDHKLESVVEELAQLLIQPHHSEQRQALVEKWTKTAKNFMVQEENPHRPIFVERHFEQPCPIRLGYYIHPHHFDGSFESEPIDREDQWDDLHSIETTDEQNQIIEAEEPVPDATYEHVESLPNVNQYANEDDTKQHARPLPPNPDMIEIYTPITLCSLFFGLYLQFGVIICSFFNLESSQTQIFDHKGNVQNNSMVRLKFELGIWYPLDTLYNFMWWAILRGVFLLLISFLPGWVGFVLLMCWIGKTLHGERSMVLTGRCMYTIE